LSKNSAKNRAAKLHICRGAADQTAETWGTISRSMNSRENRWCFNHVRNDTSAARSSSSSRAVAIEPRQISDHAMKSRRDQVRALGEQPVR